MLLNILLQFIRFINMLSKSIKFALSSISKTCPFRPIFSSISKIFFSNQCETTIVHYWNKQMKAIDLELIEEESRKNKNSRFLSGIARSHPTLPSNAWLFHLRHQCYYHASSLPFTTHVSRPNRDRLISIFSNWYQQALGFWYFPPKYRYHYFLGWVPAMEAVNTIFLNLLVWFNNVFEPRSATRTL